MTLDCTGVKASEASVTKAYKSRDDGREAYKTLKRMEAEGSNIPDLSVKKVNFKEVLLQC